jgi:GrpB-like predicted nucleotidyltransferase (UPF0157 family)
MPKLPNTLIVLPYDPNWKIEFERIRDYLMEQIGDLILEIKHVGSTSVPGLCAKPIIDIVAVMGSYDVFPAIVARLEKVGYKHEGNGGIKEREVLSGLFPMTLWITTSMFVQKTARKAAAKTYSETLCLTTRILPMNTEN